MVRPTGDIAALCRHRRQSDLFFRWAKQNLQTGRFLTVGALLTAPVRQGAGAIMEIVDIARGHCNRGRLVVRLPDVGDSMPSYRHMTLGPDCARRAVLHHFNALVAACIARGTVVIRVRNNVIWRCCRRGALVAAPRSDSGCLPRPGRACRLGPEPARQASDRTAASAMAKGRGDMAGSLSRTDEEGVWHETSFRVAIPKEGKG